MSKLKDMINTLIEEDSKLSYEDAKLCAKSIIEDDKTQGTY